ncbi:MAG: polyphosphate polymerase domain-containing protein [Oscillospiraceae bacterium]|nr:polyphosphate polymerase domain-containing protein [Oscillospiraceae bacterium]
MAYQAVFKRYELKYLITPAQRDAVLAAIAPHMALDEYGRTTIRSIYFDTPDYRLIRRSIEKPVYKEKLRIRSYRRATPHSQVFVELKKKYDHVVYKRRLSLREDEVLDWLCGKTHDTGGSQIAREIDYFLSFYEGLRPTVFLSCEREAYCCRDGGDFRVTFDENVLCRMDNLSLEADTGGTPILPEGKILMEIKCSGGIPLWMTGVLTRERIFRTSFSKYGTAYQNLIYKGDNIYA